MKQIIHIFRKDTRRFWLEIAISLVLMLFFVWTSPKQWRDASLNASYGPRGIFFIPGSVETFLPLLITIGWWLLISRAVHEERLVGDRQFWITRPYEWKYLLAAKELFIVCFVSLPLAAAQWWLLQAAGLRPTSHVGALLYDWLLLTALPILPIAALAAVTRNMARMVLTLLGIFVAGAAVAAIFISLIQRGTMQSHIEYSDPLSVPLILLTCAVVILIAYQTRRIVVGRIILVALPVLLVLISTLFSSDVVVNHSYSETSAADIKFSLPAGSPTLGSAHPAISPKQLYIQVPLRVDGIVPGDLWVGKGIRITVETGGQTLWISSWQPLAFYLPTDGNATMGFNMDRAVYDRVQSKAITLRIEIALDQAHRDYFEATQVSLADVSIPGLGVCSAILDPRYPENVNGKPTPVISDLSCRSALRDPQLTYVEAAFTRGPCQSLPGNVASPIQVQGTWIGNLSSEPAVLSINPVKIASLPFSGNWITNAADNFTAYKHLCPGAPITMTRYGLVRQLRIALTLESFQLPSYDTLEDQAR